MSSIIDAIRANVDNSLKGKGGPFFTYLIGNNGTGKSRLLNELAQLYEADQTTRAQTIPCVSNTLYDRFQIQSGNKIIYLGSRSVGNAVFHAAVDRQLAKFLFGGISSKRSFLKMLQDTLNVRFAFKINSNSKYNNDNLIENLVDKRKLRAIDINREFDSLSRRKITQLVDRTLTFGSVNKSTATDLQNFLELNPSISVLVRRSDGEFDFRDLSSGEQNRILLAAKILSSAQRYSLIIIDEPEISLHLHWQMDFHELIKKLLSRTKNFHVVIATHSPIIVSEAAKDNSTDSILVLDSSSSPKGDNDSTNEILFRKIVANSVRSYDELVLDLFDTVTYNARSVNEEIADSLLQIASGRFDLSKELEKLEGLLAKKGLTPEDAKTTRQAVALVKKHFSQGQVDANIS